MYPIRWDSGGHSHGSRKRALRTVSPGQHGGPSGKEWLEYRRRGIGGSDAAAILGISPFATARDLYYDKLKIVPFDDSESNWVAKKMGHLLEDLVAEIFHVKTGYRIYQIKKMFYHPVHTFMLADIDYFVELPGGRTAILEIKTTNYNAKDHWWSEGGQEIVPLNYEAQGRHYMAVMNVDEVFYCCLYGNNEDEVIIRHIDRDRDYEEELIALERDFWENHILTGTPPPYTEDGNLILNSVRRHFGPADPSAPELILEGNMALLVLRYLELQAQRNVEKETMSASKQKCGGCKAVSSQKWDGAAWLSARDVKRLTASAISLCVNPVLVRKTCSVCRRSIRTSTSSTSLFRKAGASM